MKTSPNLRPLLAFQKRFVDHVRGVIERNYALPLPRIRVLDAGCDCTGAQLAAIASLVRGQLVGINLAEGFPGPESDAVSGSFPRISFERMDATAMDFPDNSFDLVISANVMEHVSNPAIYIRECARVLKPGGVAYFETYPVWSGARGHHIHDEMVPRMRGTHPDYRNDGSFIPDWSHLTFDSATMRSHLDGRLPDAAVNYIVDYLYHDQDVNRWGWKRVEAALSASFPSVSIETYGVPDADESLHPQHADEDHSVCGFRAVAWKKTKPRSNGLVQRFSFLLRRKLRLVWNYKLRGWLFRTTDVDHISEP